MVGFHLFYLEMVVADGTDTLLALVSCTYHSAIESTDIQIFLFASEPLGINALGAWCW
jgi:hypothetical protein